MNCPNCRSENVTSTFGVSGAWVCYDCENRFMPRLDGDGNGFDNIIIEAGNAFDDWMEK